MREISLGDWEALLEAATTLVENNPAYREQAFNTCWVSQCVQHDQRHQSLHLQMFLQACQL